MLSIINLSLINVFFFFINSFLEIKVNDTNINIEIMINDNFTKYFEVIKIRKN